MLESDIILTPPRILHGGGPGLSVTTKSTFCKIGRHPRVIVTDILSVPHYLCMEIKIGRLWIEEIF